MNRKQVTLLVASLAIVFVASIVVFSGSPTGHATIDMFQEPEVLEFKGVGGELVVDLEFRSKDIEVDSAALTVSGDYSDWITKEISAHGGVRVSIADGNPYPVVLHADRQGKVYVTGYLNGKWMTDRLDKGILPGTPIIRTLSSATTRDDKYYHITYIDTQGQLRHVINTKIASSGSYSGDGWENKLPILEPAQAVDADKAFTHIAPGSGTSLHLVYGYGKGDAVYKKRASGRWGSTKNIPTKNIEGTPVACDGSVIENIHETVFTLTWYCDINKAIMMKKARDDGWIHKGGGWSGQPSELSVQLNQLPRFYNVRSGKLYQQWGVKSSWFTPAVEVLAAPAHEIALGGYSFVLVSRAGHAGVIAYERTGVPRVWSQTPTLISGARPFDIASMVGKDKSVYAAFESENGGMTLAYKTPPSMSPAIYVQNGMQQMPVWSYQGQFVGSANVDNLLFKDALQSYVRDRCMESPCTVPITIASQSAGELILSNLKVSYSPKAIPQNAPVLDDVEGPSPAKEDKRETIKIQASDVDSEAFKVFVCKTDKFSTKVIPGKDKPKFKYSAIEGCVDGELCKSTVVFKKSKKGWESMLCEITPNAASDQILYSIYLMDAEGNLAGPRSMVMPVNRKPSATNVEIIDTTTQLVATTVRKGDTVACTYAFSDPDKGDKKDEKATKLEWWTSARGAKAKIDAAETPVMDISKISGLKKGIKFRCGVKVADNRGHVANDFASSKTATVVDTRPTRPETLVDKTASQPSEKITATCAGSTDIDGDEVTYLYAFCKREVPWPTPERKEFPGRDADGGDKIEDAPDLFAGMATAITESDEPVDAREPTRPVHPLPQDCNAVRGWGQDNTYVPTDEDVDTYVYAVGMAVADDIGSEPTSSDTVKITAAAVEPNTPGGSSSGSSSDPEEEEPLDKKTCTNQGYLCASKCAPDTSVSMHDATCAGKVCCKAAATADLRQGPIEEKETNWLLIGLIAGIVLVAAGIGFGIWYYLRKRKQAY